LGQVAVCFLDQHCGLSAGQKEDHGLSHLRLESSSLESEVVNMTRSLIIKFFWGSIIGLVAGLVLMGVTAALAISNDIFVMSGPDVTGIRPGVLSWALLGLMALAVFVLLFAAAAHFVAWIGAVLNTAHQPDKTWFVVLLVVGLLGFVFIATIAYVIAGPDGLKVTDEASAPPQAGSAPQQVPVSTVSRPGETSSRRQAAIPGSPPNATRRKSDVGADSPLRTANRGGERKAN
jgi:hypothetical protein